METQDANCDKEAIKYSKLVEEERRLVLTMATRVLWKDINNREGKPSAFPM